MSTIYDIIATTRNSLVTIIVIFISLCRMILLNNLKSVARAEIPGPLKNIKHHKDLMISPKPSPISCLPQLRKIVDVKCFRVAFGSSRAVHPPRLVLNEPERCRAEQLLEKLVILRCRPLLS